MARVQKMLIRTGVYSAPQGQFRATPERLKHFERQFQAMTAAGIKIPCSWGHVPDALPGDADQRKNQQFFLSKHNAGYLDTLKVSDGKTLGFGADLPGCEIDDKGNLLSWTRLPDGREVKSACGEVSAAIKDWTDGKGRVWKDSIVHVAITPLPVIAGMTGFTDGTSLSTDPDGVMYLSLGGFVCELGGAMDNPAHKQSEAAHAATSSINMANYSSPHAAKAMEASKAAHAASAAGDSEKAWDNHSQAAKSHMELAESERKAGRSGSAHIAAAMAHSQAINAHDAHLNKAKTLGPDMEEETEDTPVVPPPVETPPPVTPPAAAADDGKFGHVVALLRRKGIPLPPNTTPDNMLHNLEVSCYALLEAEGKDETDTDDEQEEEEETDNMDNAPYVQEQRPVMMSLSTATDPIIKKTIQRDQDRHKAAGLASIERMVKAGFMPPTEATRLKEGIEKYELTLSTEGDQTEQPIDVELSVWKKAFSTSPAAAKASMKGGKKQPHPGNADNTRMQEEAGTELAGRCMTR